MSINLTMLNAVLEKKRPLFPERLSNDKYFEFFTFSSILSDYGFDFEDLRGGNVDGPKDGGIDGLFLIINKRLFDSYDIEDIEKLKGNIEIEVYIIQVKNQDSFKESAMDRLTASLSMLLNQSKNDEQLSNIFSDGIIEKFNNFNYAIEKLAIKQPSIVMHLYYVSKGNVNNIAIKEKADNLCRILKSMEFTADTFLIGASELHKLATKNRDYTRELRFYKQAIGADTACIALCNLTEFAKFITDDKGNVLEEMFDENVRAFQGDTEVNKEILGSLKQKDTAVDFWYLNNGVTIVADNVVVFQSKAVIKNPLIVNGLQTSYQIHEYSKNITSADEEKRNVLLKIIQEEEIGKRDKIIRATNRQTKINPSAFRSSDPIHRDIENYLETIDIYYDRRKGQRKNEGRALHKTMSIDKLAQGVLSVVLCEPNTARGRHNSALKSEEVYSKIFPKEKTAEILEAYGGIAKMVLKNEEYFRENRNDDERVYYNNLKWHTLMVSAWNTFGTTKTNWPVIGKWRKKELNEKAIEIAYRYVKRNFEVAGPEDNTAKDANFTQILVKNWKNEG